MIALKAGTPAGTVDWSLPGDAWGGKAVVFMDPAVVGQVDWALLGGQASLGALLGYAVGFTTKKAFKVGLVLLAFLLFAGIVLEQMGFLVINWAMIEEAYRGSVEQVGGLGGLIREWSDRFASYIPVGAGFGLGFVLGLRKG